MAGRNIEYEVIEKIGILKEKENGYTIQVNMISWSGAAPKLDVRNWSASGKPLKGITMTTEEAEAFAEMIMQRCNK